MQWLLYPLAYWRAMSTVLFMGFLYSVTSGFFAVVVIAVGGRVFYRVLHWVAPLHKGPSNFGETHGSARFANNQDIIRAGNLATQMTSDRYILGIALESAVLPAYTQASLALPRRGFRRRCHPVITTGAKLRCADGRVDDGHSVTIAGSGAGKGIAVVQPNVRLYEGGVVVIDPKGENFLLTYRARLRLGHRIFLMDPFSVMPEELRARYAARFNPLDALEEFYHRADHAAVFDEATAIAEMIIFRDPAEKEPHWSDKAKAFLKAVIMFVVYGRGYQDRAKTPLTLGTVKVCIYEYFSSEDGLQKFVKRCQDSPYLTAMAGQVGIIAPNERSSVLSTLLRHTDFLDSPSVRDSLDATDFNPLDLKTDKISVYLVLPANQLKAYSRLARLWVGTLLRAMMRDGTTAPRWRVLFMLDEVAQLGRLEALEQAMTLGRGYGIDVWLIFQDIHQIRDSYQDRWESFLANAKTQQFFGCQDVGTAEYVSKKLGHATIQTTSHSSSRSSNSGGSWNASHNPRGPSSHSRGVSSGRSDTAGLSLQQTGRSLLQPDEVMRLQEDQILIFLAGQYPILARKCSVLDAAVTAALDAVQPIDPPYAAKPVVQSPKAAAGRLAPVLEETRSSVGAVGAMQRAQEALHAVAHDFARGRER